MRFLIFAITILLLSCDFLTLGSARSPPFDDVEISKVVDFYNSLPGLKWKAGPNGLSGRVKYSSLASRLGILQMQKNTRLPIPSSQTNHTRIDLPREYDARKAYPNSTTISSIKDQGHCGSCWAVCTAAAFSDRLYVASNGKINVNMSAQQLTGCASDNGCTGAYLKTAWKYIENNGLVSGGDYGSNEGCQPYPYAPNEESPPKPVCSNEVCPIRYKAKDVRQLPPNEYDIREEIYRNGPVTAPFIAYLSFTLVYEKGIYSKTPFENNDEIEDIHAARIIGWGEENGTKYWIAANSWGPSWGENGTFRIVRGVNECSIESEVVAGLPVL